MFSRFFKPKNFLDKQVVDLAALSQQKPTDVVRLELTEFIAEWSKNGLADITLQEFQGLTYLFNPMNRGIHFNARQMNLSDAAWKELMFHFMRVLIHQGYVSGHGEVKTATSEGRLTTTYYSYLKPSIKYRAQNPVLQLYGNMYIELLLTNDKTTELKLMSNIYQGRGYVEPHPFEELIALFFNY